LNEAGPGLFNTLGSPMVLGREFDERDAPSSPLVAVVNDAFARKYFASSSPIGKRIFAAGSESPFEIVGVVKNVKYRNLRQEFPPTVYLASGQSTRFPDFHTYFVRTAAPAGDMSRAIEAALGRLDRSLRAPEMKALSEHISRSLLRERMLATLAGFFGLLALVLACVGMYGVMAFQAERRTKEVGIRMALGARPGEVIRMLLREAGGLVVAGSAIGLCAAFLLAGTTEKLVFGLKPNDPATFAGAVAVLGAVAAVAAFLPGQRAARVNPADVLRID
jgi:putative ABC transport system permease protein